MADQYADAFAHPFVALSNPALMCRMFDGYLGRLQGSSLLRGKAIVVRGQGLRPFAEAHPLSGDFRYRILPRGVSFDFDVLAFADTVTLFCYDENLTVVRIDSPETASAFRTAFGLLWAIAQPYRN